MKLAILVAGFAVLARCCYNRDDARRDAATAGCPHAQVHCDIEMWGCGCHWGCGGKWDEGWGEGGIPVGTPRAFRDFREHTCQDAHGVCRELVGWNSYCDKNICRAKSNDGQVLKCTENKKGNSKPTCCRPGEEPDRGGNCKRSCPSGTKLCEVNIGVMVLTDCIPEHVECCKADQQHCHGKCIPHSATCCGDGQQDCHGKCISSSATCCRDGQQDCHGKCISSSATCCGDGQQDCHGKCISSSATCCGDGQQDCHGKCIDDGLLCCQEGKHACHGICIPTGTPCGHGNAECQTGQTKCGVNANTGREGILTCNSSQHWEYANDCPKQYPKCVLRGDPAHPYCDKSAES